MARPKSAEKRSAILNATSFLIGQYGLSGSPTSLIAKEAGVSEGTVFHYFSNKDNLLNQLYLHIKQQLSSELKQIKREDTSFKDYLYKIWETYIHWGIHHPIDSKTLNQLLNSGRLSTETMMQVKSFLPDIEIGNLSSKERLSDTEGEFLEAIFIALATTTIDFCLTQSAKRSFYIDKGFSLLWKMYDS